MAMQFRALQRAYVNDVIVEVGDIVHSDDDLSADMAPADHSTPEVLSPIFERVT